MKWKPRSWLRVVKRLKDDLSSACVRHTAPLLADRRYAFVRSVYGPELRDCPNDVTHRLCVEGYGPFISDAIQAQEGEFIFLDIGANAGVFSLLADRMANCRRIYAFEPIPETFRRLVINSARNRAGKIHPVRAAISDTGRDFQYMTCDPRHSGMARFVGKRRSGSIGVRTLNGRALARLIGDPALPILAKIDVEGAEALVLGALGKAPFYRNLNRLIIEVSRDRGGSAGTETLKAMLAEDGFVERARSGPDNHYDALYERS